MTVELPAVRDNSADASDFSPVKVCATAAARRGQYTVPPSGNLVDRLLAGAIF